VEYINFVDEMASRSGVDEVSCQITRVERVVRRTLGFNETEERSACRLPWAGFFVRFVLASTVVSWMDGCAGNALFCCPLTSDLRFTSRRMAVPLSSL